MLLRPPRSTPTYTLFPSTALFRSIDLCGNARERLPREIDGLQREGVAIDVDADRVAGVALDDELGRRLAAPAASLAGFLDQAVAQQPLGDVGDRRRRQSRDRRQIDPRQRAVDADRVQRHALIVIGGTLEIGS